MLEKNIIHMQWGGRWKHLNHLFLLVGSPRYLNPSGAWEGDYVRDEPGQTLLGCDNAGDGQLLAGLTSRGPLRTADGFAMVASLSAVSLGTAGGLSLSEGRELGTLQSCTSIFTLQKRT